MPVLLIAIVFLIIYGSLYPWQFRHPSAPPLNILLASSPLELNRFALRDAVVNLALYIPLGAVAAIVFRRSRFRYIWPLLIGAAISFSVEITQAYTPTRRPSLMDIACNIGGTALGVVAARILDLATASRHRTHNACAGPEKGALVVIFLWVAYLSLPLFPALGRTVLYEKLRAVYYAPFSRMVAVSFAAMWFAVGRIALKAWPRASRWWLLPAILLIPAQLFIVDRQPRLSEVMGAAIGAFVFLCFGARRAAGKWIAWIFPAMILLRGLAPFHFSSLPQDFIWIPFRPALEAEWQPGIGALLDKGFWYSATVWLIRDSGVSLRTATLWTAQLLGAIEIAQIWLPGRSPEITDPFLALAAGAILWLLRDRPVRQTV